MPVQSYARFKWTQSQLDTDPEYLYLSKQLRDITPAFAEILDALTPEQRDTVTEYLGLRAELEDRVLEIACFAP